jgi:hypothetical protein
MTLIDEDGISHNHVLHVDFIHGYWTSGDLEDC